MIEKLNRITKGWQKSPRQDFYPLSAEDVKSFITKGWRVYDRRFTNVHVQPN